MTTKSPYAHSINSFLTEDCLSENSRKRCTDAVTQESVALTNKLAKVPKVEPGLLKTFCTPRMFSLTDEEKELFDCLLNFVQSTNLQTEIRAAGGWVRDKIMNRISCDIDIALNDMTGLDFASRFNTWRGTQGLSEHSIGVIQRNPEQSKHLETATMTLSKLSLDFVNLRCETYANGSRIPNSTEFGSPTEDAQRRDFTVNALFYNLNEDCIEDFTGKGLDDLQHRILSTPIDPIVTLRDDPLRLLRGARFAAVLNFQLDEKFCLAARDSQVHINLDTMVSRERMGQEIDKIFLKGVVATGLEFLCTEANVANIVFSVPQEILDDITWWKQGLKAVIAYQNWIENNKDSIPESNSSIKTNHCVPLTLIPDVHRLLMYAAFFSPLHNVTVSRTRGHKCIPAAYYVLFDSLKLKRQDAERVSHFIKSVYLLKTVIMYKKEGDITLLERIAKAELNIHDDFCDDFKVIFGVLIRYIGESWKLVLGLSYVLEKIENNNMDPTKLEELYNVGHMLDKRHVLHIRPMFNGKELQTILSKLPTGPTIKKILDYEIQFMIQNPSFTTDKIACHLKSRFQEFL